MLQYIKARLAYAGFSQAYLAKELNYSTATVSQWLNGHFPLPDGMEATIGHTITRMENAETAANEARARSLAESAAEATP